MNHIGTLGLIYTFYFQFVLMLCFISCLITNIFVAELIVEHITVVLFTAVVNMQLFVIAYKLVTQHTVAITYRLVVAIKTKMHLNFGLVFDVTEMIETAVKKKFAIEIGCWAARNHLFGFEISQILSAQRSMLDVKPKFSFSFLSSFYEYLSKVCFGILLWRIFSYHRLG